MINLILEKIKEYNRIIIHRHVRPDGDCIGTQHALKKAIQYNFPEKEVYAVGDIIPDYLEDYGVIDDVTEDMYNGSLVIVVDTANESRICGENYKLGEYIIKIDHHDDSSDYANINYVDPKTPACGAILTRLLRSWNFKFNQEIATYLYVAITTDTGRFRFRGVNEEVMANAGYLISQGVEIDKLYTKLYTKDKESFKLQGYVYENFKTTESGVAYIYFSQKLMKEYNVTKDDAANLVNSLDSIKGSLIWVAFIEQDDEVEIRVRLRSRFVAINDIARNYRGGGHLQAAGATLYSKDEIDSILNELDLLHKEFKENNKELF